MTTIDRGFKKFSSNPFVDIFRGHKHFHQLTASTAKLLRPNHSRILTRHPKELKEKQQTNKPNAKIMHNLKGRAIYRGFEDVTNMPMDE